jgi:LAO/AO transport system kinase
MEKAMELVRRMLAGDADALSQLISAVEDDLINISEIMSKIHQNAGHGYYIGITGPPGVGKSTLIDKLTTAMREEGHTVGIVMVDPTSPITGGALLGDRVRMQKHYLDEGVFMRSMGTRGGTGGLSRKARAVVRLLDVFKKDFVLVETTGVGQVETDICSISDTNILVLAPNTGDVIQAMKAGIMETADIFVINKTDLGKADNLAVDLSLALEQQKRRDNWIPPIIDVQASNSLRVQQVYEAIQLHREFLNEGLFLQHRRRKGVEDFKKLVREELLDSLVTFLKNNQKFKANLDRVERGETDPYSACAEILNSRETWETLRNLFTEKR